ncbi:MAG TPA: hypothetical protein VFE47_31885 [Tepidisphaeraceae bacterium]|nr:hypothetical protein [Tepidisphaeraceae bacterium]
MFPMIIAEAYRPFMDPLPAWENGRWPWLLIPLCVAVSIVYKSARCKSMKAVFREAMGLTLTIILGMIAAAIVLGFLVRGLER